MGGFSLRPVKNKRVRPAVEPRRESPKHLQGYAEYVPSMGTTIELDADLYERLQGHLEEGETVEEFIAELLSMYETEGSFMQEGYSE
jgi:hypothetical protein